MSKQEVLEKLKKAQETLASVWIDTSDMLSDEEIGVSGDARERLNGFISCALNDISQAIETIPVYTVLPVSPRRHHDNEMDGPWGRNE